MTIATLLYHVISQLNYHVNFPIITLHFYQDSKTFSALSKIFQFPDYYRFLMDILKLYGVKLLIVNCEFIIFKRQN